MIYVRYSDEGTIREIPLDIPTTSVELTIRSLADDRRRAAARAAARTLSTHGAHDGATVHDRRPTWH